MRIAICDDSTQDRENLIKCIQTWEEVPYVLTEFSSGEDLLTALQEGAQFDLLFLDVYMDGKNGIDTAKSVRLFQRELMICFLTASPDFALDAFGVRASNYLLKPVDADQVRSLLDDAVHTSQRKGNQIWMVSTEEGDARIDVNQLMYCEGDGHYFTLHLTNERAARVRMTHSQLLKSLVNHSQMVSCGKSFVVNLYYVRVLNRQEVLLTDGVRIPVSRGFYPTFKDAYFNFY